MKNTENFLFNTLIALIVPLLFLGIYGFAKPEHLITKPVEVVQLETQTVVIIGKRIHEKSEAKNVQLASKN